MKKVYACIVLVVVLAGFPFVLWFGTASSHLSVAIIDKTVPPDTYREHSGIVWLLNHLKYKNSSSSYDIDTDYYGYHEKEQTKEKPLPADYSQYDVIYLADTYGVYQDDLIKEKEERQGAKSEKIYGGLQEKEWNAIMQRVSSNKKSMLIAEYNTFASPTSAAVRASVTNYLGVQWEGWTGRYFKDLSFENLDIPKWVEEEYGANWTYKGGGFLLVNDLTHEVEVLEAGKEVEDKGIELTFTQEGQKLFGLSKPEEYNYWFDIVTAKDDAETLAQYSWSLTKEGEKKLSERGIPMKFDAVVKRDRAQTKSYYFAGDFNDVQHVPFFYQAKGMAEAHKYMDRFTESDFYWSAYVPMMKAILKDYETFKPVVSAKKSDLTYTSRIYQDQLQIKVNGQWESMKIRGVNMGMGKPGAFPGEAAITEDEYYRWFESIGKLNANLIRVYTIHPPDFYQALKRYNEQHEKKLYVLHGVWIEEERLEQTLDAYDKKTLADFRDEMKKAVDVVHGNAVIDHVPGHASGLYEADVSEYIAGWVMGIEWYPYMVEETNKKYAGIGEYNGTFFETKKAAPFEYWLAEQLDFMMSYEYDAYHRIRPMSFTNWVTTDLLEHKSEPSEKEDVVGVNPNVVYTKGKANETGQFASYHVYPYYPDFFNYDEKLKQYIDHRGNKNSYAGYLNALHKAHRLPVLIAEFGVPSSRGLTHENPYGWNQGFLNEKEQGEIMKSLYEDIMAEGLLGGVVFTWQDEWFKRTWNTADYDNPDRRPYWSNAQTNEQQFGLMSFDRLKIKVDGKEEDWENEPVNEGKTTLSIDHDERYLYVKVKGEQLKNTAPSILFDVIDGQGNTFMKKLPGASFKNGVDVIAKIDKNEANSRMMIDPYYDFHTYLYGKQLKLLEPEPPTPSKNSGEFRPVEYVLNGELLIPDTRKKIPFSTYETGKLRQGNGNPNSSDYDSLTDYAWKDNVLEIRIPWLLLQAKDPSQREFIGDLYENGLESSRKADGISIGVVFEKEGKLVSSIPEAKDGEIKLSPYTWKAWDKPQYKERLKQSYYIMQDAFKKAW